MLAVLGQGLWAKFGWLELQGKASGEVFWNSKSGIRQFGRENGGGKAGELITEISLWRKLHQVISAV